MLWKIKLKSLIGYLIYNIVLLTISYLLNRFYQMLIFVVFYELIQNCFKYRFHADSIQKDPIKAVKLCKVITISVEITYLAICQNINISVYSNLFIIFLIALINCLLEFSLRHFIKEINDLSNRDNLLVLCRNAKLSKSATNRMCLKYVEGKSYQDIADLECVDVDAIKKSINRSRNKIFKDQD